MNSSERVDGKGLPNGYRALAGSMHQRRGFCDTLVCIALYTKLGLREDVLHFDIEIGIEKPLPLT